MKFSDIVALAKAGYKPSDVKELLELCETDPSAKKAEPPKIDESGKDSDDDDDSGIEDAFKKLAESN